MQVVKDYFGNDVAIGNALVHITKGSCYVYIHYSIVYGFIWRGDEYTNIKVVSVRKSYKGMHYYRATLTKNNFVCIPLDSIPEDIRKKLLDTIKR